MRRALKSSFLSAQRQFGRFGKRSRLFGPERHKFTIFSIHSLSSALSDTALLPERLRELLSALLEAGFACIDLPAAVSAARSKELLRQPSFVISCDDGYANNFDPGLRILQDLRLTATLFVTTGFIDGLISPPWHSSNRALLNEFRGPNEVHFRPLEWSQIRELAASGVVRIGSHTVMHHMTGKLPENRIREELTASRKILEDRIDRIVDLFAYPYGVRRYGAYSPLTERLVREAGYQCSCTSEIGRARVGAGTYLLPRIPLLNRDTGLDAVAKACGSYDWVAWAQSCYQRVFSNPH